VKALEEAKKLNTSPFITALRFTQPDVVKKILDFTLNKRKALPSILTTSTSPEAQLFLRNLTILGLSSKLIDFKKEFIPHSDIYPWDTFAEIEPCFSELAAMMGEIKASNDAIFTYYFSTVRKKSETGDTDFTQETWKLFLVAHDQLAAIFKPQRMRSIVNFIESTSYKNIYAELHAEITAISAKAPARYAKKILRIASGTEVITLPKTLAGKETSWKALVTEHKKNNPPKQILQKDVAPDKSFVVRETSEYVVIKDPRNEMHITLYKTREPGAVIPSIRYHHRVTDLFAKDRAELVATFATEKGLSPVIANEAIRQKTPALAIDWYIHYAHDGFFTDKSGRNIPNKTLFCLVEPENGFPAKYYYFVWGFFSDEQSTNVCYHRGLSYLASIDEAIEQLREKTGPSFVFPELEKPTK
jgi:hypothetical protein